MKMKPFPWKCGQCREKSVQLATIPYTTEIGHDGRTYTVTIPDLEVGRCERCGEIVLPHDASKRITETFRQQLGHLRPEQIRERRESLGLTQKELAKLIGSADATLSRLETGGQIQHRALDRILRLFFAFENVRASLADEAHLHHLGLEDAEMPLKGINQGTKDDPAPPKNPLQAELRKWKEKSRKDDTSAIRLWAA